MAEQSPNDILPTAIAGLYFISCLSMAIHARRLGKELVRWLAVCILCTPPIAGAYLYMERRMNEKLNKNKHAENKPGGPPADSVPVTCPHCHKVILKDEVNAVKGARTCPRCGFEISEGHLA